MEPPTVRPRSGRRAPVDDGETIRTERLDLLPLRPAFVEAVKRGDRAAAESEIGAVVSRWLLGEPSHVVQLLLAQSAPDAAALGLLGRAIVVVGPNRKRRVVGSVGFHGPPDERRRLEIGFSLEPAARQRGYAAEAVRALIEWARHQVGVSRFLISLPTVGEAIGPVPIEIGFGPADWPEDALRALLPPGRPGRPADSG